MDVYEKALLLHEQWQGKLSTELKAKLENAEDLTYAYIVLAEVVAGGSGQRKTRAIKRLKVINSLDRKSVV